MSRWVFAVLVFALGLALDTRSNQFPYYYHPDESKKVDQILTGERNFNHPLLLLTTSEIIWKVAGRPGDPQKVVELGRWICAVFAALGTVFFALAAWSWQGRLAGLTTGILLTLNHQVFELAHYMKEDPSLYLGVGFATWTFILYAQQPTRKNVLLLGCAVGLAFSGKYLGIIMLPPALFLIWKSTGQQKTAHVGWLITSLLLVFILINLRLFFELPTFLESFSKEMDWAVRGQKDLTRRVPHSIYLNIFVSNTTPLIWLLLVVFFGVLWRQRRSTSAVTWALVGLLLGWFILLSFSPKTNDRYFLPLTGLLYLLAGVGAVFLWHTTMNKGTAVRTAFVLILVAAAGWEGKRTVQFAQAFAQDDRAELTDWILKNIPLTATIAYDSRVNLPDEEVHHELAHPLPHRLLRETFVADIASPAGLKKHNINYVVVTESTYGRFFLDSLRPKEGQLEEYQQRAAFYQKLLSRPPLWKRDRGNVLYLHPGLEVYETAP